MVKERAKVREKVLSAKFYGVEKKAGQLHTAIRLFFNLS